MTQRARAGVICLMLLAMVVSGCGKDKPTAPSVDPATVTVYVTATGTKYHRGDCSYLSSSKIPISLKEAKERGYTPCSRCQPPE